jgi:hypothetical protein
MVRHGVALVVIAAATLVSTSASAGLGEPVASVAKDHLALHGATLAVTTREGYAIHETTTTDGATVRQFVSPSGTVFAVSWAGRTQPDLQLLLAKHYTRYLAATKEPHASHKVLSVATPDVVINVARHVRGFTGSALIPALVPAKVSVADLR